MNHYAKRETELPLWKRVAAWAGLLFLLALMVFFFWAPVHAQEKSNTYYAAQFAGADVGAKITAAQAQCSPNTAIPCTIVIDAILAGWPQGTTPARCAQCYWIDYTSVTGWKVTPLVLASTGKPWYDVIAYGAKGDGSTDDTTAIQNAINVACTGVTSAPVNNTCTSWVAGNAIGGTVYFPVGDYHVSAPLVIYGGIRLVGAGKLISKISKTTNTVGTLPSITAGTGVGRNATSCGGGTCVDAFNNDAIIQVAYISSGNTDYAYRWAIRDLALYGSGTSGTKYGIYAPRAAQAEMKNLYIFLNCSQGAPANCGNVQGSGFWTEDSWLMRHEGITVDSSYYGWNHVNDGSGLGSGTSGIFANDWAVNVGCSGFHFYGLSYSNMTSDAVDHFNKKGTDLVATDPTCLAYSFNTVNGMSINAGGAEDIIGGIIYAAASSVSISGGFKSFAQSGQTSAGTLATLMIDTGATVTMNGSIFSAVSSPGNIFNIVLQGGSTLVDINSTLPTGGNTFIGYGGGSIKIDTGNPGTVMTNASGAHTVTPTSDSFPETTAPVGAAGKAVCYADSTSHTLKCSYNNASFFPIPQIIGSGTATMTTAAIAAGACGTTVTVAASGVLTTDSITWSFNAAPLANPAVLQVSNWPTANNVNFQYCNPTAGSVTPNAATLNWRVGR